ncbi:MAG: phenylalanine 4-monooxygenase [Ilumatobacteraceae bacterium]
MTVVDNLAPATAPSAAYWRRREEIAALAAGLAAEPAEIDYLDAENRTWASVASALAPRWERVAASEVIDARDRLGLPTDRVPQLREVDERLAAITGFRFRGVDGILPADEFFGALSVRVFPSTQYLRWEGDPFYTPEPDVVHEVIGHANCLACPELAELHRVAGDAVGRVERPESVQALADVFWFTVEFGVVLQRGRWRAYGAGLLSSPGELDWYDHGAEIRPLGVAGMVSTAYDIHRYQPVLFGARSLTEVVDVVGGFYETATDGRIERLLAA